MEGQAMFLDCPADLGNDGAARCGLPAEVEVRYTAGSTEGPLESAKIRCPRGHWFNGPIESLTAPENRDAAPRPPGVAWLIGVPRASRSAQSGQWALDIDAAARLGFG